MPIKKIIPKKIIPIVKFSLLVLFLSSAAVNCGNKNSAKKSNPAPTFVLKLTPQMTLRDDDAITVILEFFKADGQTPAKHVRIIEFLPWMPTCPGGAHSAYIDEQVIEYDTESPHRVRVSGFAFQMAGAWEFKVTAEVDGTTDQVIIPVKVAKK